MSRNLAKLETVKYSAALNTAFAPTLDIPRQLGSLNVKTKYQKSFVLIVIIFVAIAASIR